MVAQYGQPIQVAGMLVVLDRGCRGVQPGHVRLDYYRGLVREAAVDPVADDVQQPAGGGEHAGWRLQHAPRGTI
jgi:hypothetical protein